MCGWCAAYCREGVETERFRRENQEYFVRNARLIRVQALFYPSLGFILGLAGVLVLWLGARHVIEGRITVGQFVAFNAYLLMLSWPMIAFGFVTICFSGDGGLASDVRRPRRAPGRARPVAAAAPPGSGARGEIAQGAESDRGRWDPGCGFPGGIEFRGLSFAYNGRPVLREVSARVEPGRVLGVIGPTGSGKSTLLALLPRLFNPPRGTVFIDGVDVLDLPLTVLRRQIAMVPQDPFLFSDTIAGNVSFGVEAAGAPGAGDPHAGALDAGAPDAARDAGAVVAGALAPGAARHGYRGVSRRRGDAGRRARRHPVGAGRSSGRRWRGRSRPMRRSCSSTTPSRPSTPVRKRTSWPGSAGSCAGAHPSSCRTASRRCGPPT